MAEFFWDSRKNEKLKAERGVTFDEVIRAVADGRVLALLDHANQRKYQGQRVFVVEIDGYAYLVPFVDRDGTVTLKTIIPSRKATRKYLKGGRDHG